MKIILLLLLLLSVAGIALVGAWLLLPKPSLEVEDQPARDYFVVEKVTVTKSGFLVILAANKYHKLGKKVVGYHPQLLIPGTYREIKIAKFFIQGAPSASEQAEEEVFGGYLYFATLYEDADASSTLSEADLMMTDWLGRAVVRPFKALMAS